jgi:hypothetical protein
MAMMWTYVVDTGYLYDPDGVSVAAGYAGGNCGKNPEGKNNPDMQDRKSIGPLPCGFYTFGQPVLQSHLGPFAIPLIPYPDNEMFGRGGFYIHGDTTPGGNASEGCIILPRLIRNQLWNSTDHKLEVVSGE